MVQRKIMVGVLKLGVSAGILAYLVWEATAAGRHGNAFAALLAHSLDWGQLTLALLVFITSILLTLVRWWYLVQALGVPCRLLDAVRAGFWGLLFNLAPFGVVSGDLVKAYVLARRHADHVPRVLASVLVDRVVGVYLLFVLVACVIPLTDFGQLPGREITLLQNGVLAGTLLGGVVIAAMMVPHLTGSRGLRALGRLPRVGPLLEHVVQSVRMYRHRPGTLLLAAAATLATHVLSALTCFLIARGLAGAVLPLADQLVVVPMSIVAGILPLPLGPFEFVLEFLYTELPWSVALPKGQGLVVALVYRMLGIVVAAGGVACCFRTRGEVAAASHAADMLGS